MSRVISSRQPQAKTTQIEQKTSSRYGHVGPVVKIIDIFIVGKQRKILGETWQKIRRQSTFNNKRAQLVKSVFNVLSGNKTKEYLSFSFSQLILNKKLAIKKQAQDIANLKTKVRNKSVTILGIIFQKLLTKKLSSSIQTLNVQSKAKYRLYKFKSKHIQRIFTTLYLNKLRLAFRNIQSQKIFYLKLTYSIKRVQKIMNSKKQLRIGIAFSKLQAFNKTTETQQQETKESSIQNKNSRVKQQTVRGGPKTDVVEQDQKNDKVMEIEAKNKDIENKIKQARLNNDKQVNGYNLKIGQLESEHQSLKFNSGILDEAIQQLDTQLLNRQKKSHKTLSNSELWGKIYCNFLYLLNKYSGQTVPKQKIMSSLLVPLPPLNIGIDTLKAQNEVFTQLLTEYKKFYETVQFQQQQQEDNLLPYDILASKNRFLYATLQALIRQGIGSNEQIQQLQTDLENASKIS